MRKWEGILARALNLKGLLVSKKLLMKHLLSRGIFLSRFCGLVLLFGVFMGCGEDPQQLFDTAQFEEQQHNQAHARELYERILRDYSDSPVARKAQERLKEIREVSVEPAK